MINTLTEPIMSAHSKKTKQLKAKQNKQQLLIKTLKKLLVNQIHSIPDKIFWEEIEFARLFWGKDAMKNLEKKSQTKDLQWVLGKIDIDKIVDRAEAELREERKKKRKT
jgi:hypothetical protein